MTSILRSSILVLSVLGIAAHARERQWGRDLPQAEFKSAIGRVIAAARADRPFESLRGRSDSTGRWRTLVTLPGATAPIRPAASARSSTLPTPRITTNHILV